MINLLDVNVCFFQAGNFTGIINELCNAVGGDELIGAIYWKV